MCKYKYKYGERKGKPCPHDKYGKVEWEGKTYCIFHAPMEAKKDRIDEFWKKFNTLIKKFRKDKAEEWDFEGFIFPDTGDWFREYKFPESIKVNFRWAQFSGEANFKGAKFQGETNFQKAQFDIIADFRESIFYKNVDFKKVEFNCDISFKESHFMSDTSFEGAYFGGESNFEITNFHGYVNFREVFCGDAISFAGARFNSDIDFSGSKFRNIKFFRVFFKDKAFFEGITFKGEIEFCDVIFNDYADFMNSSFGYDAFFISVSFLGIADFNSARFGRGVIFQNALFDKGVIFTNIKIFCNKKNEKLKAWFAGSKFFGSSHFDSVYCEIPVDFSGTSFHDSVDFSKSYFKARLDFSSVSFLSQVNFTSSVLSEVIFTGASLRVKPYLGGLYSSSKNALLKDLVTDAVIEYIGGYKKIKTDNKTGEMKYLDDKDEPFTIEIEGGDIGGVISIKAPLNDIYIKNINLRSSINIIPTSERRPLGEISRTHLYVDGVNFLGDTSISDVHFQEMTNCAIAANMRIIESDLSEAHFDRVDLSRIDFENVKWAKIGRSRSSLFLKILNLIFKYKLIRYRRTDGLYDEILKGSKSKIGDCYLAPSLKDVKSEEIERLEEMYRQVASSYESRRRYGMAGHFKAGEFEVRRYHANILERVILAIYRWISFYGEEVIKPLILLVLVLPLTTALIYLFFHNEIFSSGYNYRLLYDIWNYNWDWGVLWSIIKAFL